MSTAIVPGAVVWLAIAACTVAWLAFLVATARSLPGPRRVVRWLLESWVPRLTILAAWAAAGWHIFCQRP